MPAVAVTDLDDMRQAWGEAAREDELETVAAVADAGVFQVGAVAVGLHAADGNAVVPYRQSHGDGRRWAPGPAAEAVAADFVEETLELVSLVRFG